MSDQNLQFGHIRVSDSREGDLQTFDSFFAILY